MPSFVTGLVNKVPALKYFIDPIENHYMDFEGTATRQQYWMYILMQIIVGFVLGIVLGTLSAIFGMISENLGMIIGVLIMILAGLISLALLLPSLGIAVRRLRDAGFSPWLILLALIPVGNLIVLILLCLPSKSQAASAE